MQRQAAGQKYTWSGRPLDKADRHASSWTGRQLDRQADGQAGSKTVVRKQLKRQTQKETDAQHKQQECMKLNKLEAQQAGS